MAGSSRFANPGNSTPIAPTYPIYSSLQSNNGKPRIDDFRTPPMPLAPPPVWPSTSQTSGERSVPRQRPIAGRQRPTEFSHPNGYPSMPLTPSFYSGASPARACRITPPAPSEPPWAYQAAASVSGTRRPSAPPVPAGPPWADAYTAWVPQADRSAAADRPQESSGNEAVFWSGESPRHQRPHPLDGPYPSDAPLRPPEAVHGTTLKRHTPQFLQAAVVGAEHGRWQSQGRYPTESGTAAVLPGSSLLPQARPGSSVVQQAAADPPTPIGSITFRIPKSSQASNASRFVSGAPFAIDGAEVPRATSVGAYRPSMVTGPYPPGANPYSRSTTPTPFGTGSINRNATPNRTRTVFTSVPQALPLRPRVVSLYEQGSSSVPQPLPATSSSVVRQASVSGPRPTVTGTCTPAGSALLPQGAMRYVEQPEQRRPVRQSSYVVKPGDLDQNIDFTSPVKAATIAATPTQAARMVQPPPASSDPRQSSPSRRPSNSGQVSVVNGRLVRATTPTPSGSMPRSVSSAAVQQQLAGTPGHPIPVQRASSTGYIANADTTPLLLNRNASTEVLAAGTPPHKKGDVDEMRHSIPKTDDSHQHLVRHQEVDVFCIHTIHFDGDRIDPTEEPIKSQVLIELESFGVSRSCDIEALANAGGLNEGMWCLSYDDGTLILKLVKAQRRHPALPTEAENCVSIIEKRPTIINDHALTFPIKIFRCVGPDNDHSHNLTVMRKAAGQGFDATIAQKCALNKVDSLMQDLESLGSLLAQMHAVYGMQHGDVQPSNVFHDEANGWFSLVDCGGMGPHPYKDDDDVQHLIAGVALLTPHMGEEFQAEVRKRLEASYVKETKTQQQRRGADQA